MFAQEPWMDICPEGMRAVTSLPHAARPAVWRDHTNATGRRLIGAEVAPSPAGYNSRSPERPAGVS
jgi:hypothetical protein